MSEEDPRAAGGEAEGGFRVSEGRAAFEIAAVLLALGALALGVLALANHFADRLVEGVPEGADRALGDRSAELLALGSTPCPNPAALAYVERVAEPLLAALPDRRFEFRFRVVRSPEVNAFALPGGNVVVNSALLEAAESGDEVAAVLAHEIHHVTRRHGTARMLRELGASALLTLAFGGTEVAVPARLAHDLASNAYDRAQEAEADRLGLELLARAGLDPRGMARFFERLARSAASPPELLSTHPDPGGRAAAAELAAASFTPRVTLPSPREARCE